MNRHPSLLITPAVLLLAACAATPAASPPATSAEPPATSAEPPRATATPAPSPTEPPPLRFALVGDDPVIRRDGPGQAILPGALIPHEGGYTLVARRFLPDGSSGLLVYESTDLLTWTKQTDEAFEIDLGVPLDRPGAIPTSGLALEDGSTVLFLEARTLRVPQSTGAWRATAPDADGPWEPEADPILDSGTGGAWDSRAAGFPSVARDGEQWLMIYDGNRIGSRDSLGLATSSDGLTWTKYDDPATTDGEHAESDPVLEPGTCGELDARSVQVPRLVRDGDGWLMTYHGFSLTGQLGTILAADSPDGVTWRCRSPERPVLALEEAPLGSEFLHTNVLFRTNEGELRMLVEIGRNDGTDVWLARPVTQ